MVDLVVVGAAAEHDADDAVAAARAGLRDEHLAVGALVDALDLPDVDLDAGVLDLGDRAAHQLGAQLGVVAVGVAADGLQLGSSAGTSSSKRNLRSLSCSQSREPLELAELARFSSASPSGL